MASIKQLTDRKYKITVSNGYRKGKKICKAKTIQVPLSVPSRSIRQYVMHKAEELERRLKFGFIEDSSTAFQDYAEGWLSRQRKYAPSTLASYRRLLEVVYPFIGAIPLAATAEGRQARCGAQSLFVCKRRRHAHPSRYIHQAPAEDLRR